MEKTYKILGESTLEVEWNLCSDKLPPIPKKNERRPEYLTVLEDGIYAVLGWCDGWNCHYDEDGEVFREAEIKDVVAWAIIPRIEVKES